MINISCDQILSMLIDYNSENKIWIQSLQMCFIAITYDNFSHVLCFYSKWWDAKITTLCQWHIIISYGMCNIARCCGLQLAMVVLSFSPSRAPMLLHSDYTATLKGPNYTIIIIPIFSYMLSGSLCWHNISRLQAHDIHTNNDYNTQRHGSRQKMYYDGIHANVPVPVSLH